MHWQKELLNAAGPGLWVLLLLLFLFTVENRFLPLFYNASYLRLEQPILSGLRAAMLIILGFKFSLSVLAGTGVGDGTCGEEAESEQPSFCQLSSLSPLF